MRDAVFFPANLLTINYFLQGSLNFVKRRISTFNFNKNYFARCLFIKAFDNDKIKWLSNKFRFSWFVWKIRKIRCELLAELSTKN